MQLLECIVSKPGLLDNIKLRFDKGITVIYGKNESGKTLIAKAIIDTLWGEFSGCFSLNANTWDDLYLEVLFKNSSGSYRFIKKKKESFLINFTDAKEDAVGREKEILQRKTEDHENTGALFVKLYEATNDRDTTRLFNKIDMRTFMNISYIPDPIEIAKDGKLDYNIIQKFLLEDSSNFYTLYENISDVIPDWNSAGKLNNPISNEILQKESELKKIAGKMQIINIQSSKIDRLYKEKARLKQELNDLNDELSGIRDYKAKLLNIQRSFKKLADINLTIEMKKQEKQIELEKINSILRMEEDIKHHYPQFYNFKESNIKNLKKIQETYREVRDVHEEIANFYLLRTGKRNRYKNIILTIDFVSVVILSALFGISSFASPIPIVTEYKIQFIIGLLTLSISSSLSFLLYYLFALRSNDLKRIMKEKSYVEKKLAETLHGNNITLNEYKLEAIYEFLVKYFEEYGEYSISQSEISSIKESLKDEDYIKAIDDELERLKREENAIKQEVDNEQRSLKDDCAVELDNEKINKLLQNKNQKIKKLKESISRTNNFILQTNDEIKHSKARTDEIIFLNEEKNSLEDTLKKLKNYKISIEYIINLLKEAIVKRGDKQISELVKTAGRNFHFLTDNQYTGSVNDDIIRRVIKGEMRGDELHLSILHLLLLSIKLAVTDNFDELEINLPLIIDEPFQQMDDQRINRFKKILDEIAARRQIIIFTHSSLYKDCGSFIEL